MKTEDDFMFAAKAFASAAVSFTCSGKRRVLPGYRARSKSYF